MHAHIPNGHPREESRERPLPTTSWLWRCQQVKRRSRRVIEWRLFSTRSPLVHHSSFLFSNCVMVGRRR